MASPTADAMPIPWLRELEDRVREAADRLREARTENDSLRRRVAELESELATTGPAAEEAEAWTRERTEIRGRVERLAEHLEKLLAGDEDS